MFVTIVDDLSRHTWMYMIKNKSDVIQILQDFFAYTHTQFQCLVECVRSDNAKELCEWKMMQYYIQHGIIHQKSCTETPQQNGVVERKHRHLLEVARSLFFQSHVLPAY